MDSCFDLSRAYHYGIASKQAQVSKKTINYLLASIVIVFVSPNERPTCAF